MRIHPILGQRIMHEGIDLPSDYGTKVRATLAGRVVRAGRDGGYGNLIEIDHGGGIVSRYGHLSSFAVVAGDFVEGGHIIGYVGSTGRSTGNHLHFEVREDGRSIDPLVFLRTERAPSEEQAPYELDDTTPRISAFAKARQSMPSTNQGLLP